MTDVSSMRSYSTCLSIASEVPATETKVSWGLTFTTVPGQRGSFMCGASSKVNHPQLVCCCTASSG